MICLKQYLALSFSHLYYQREIIVIFTNYILRVQREYPCWGLLRPSRGFTKYLYIWCLACCCHCWDLRLTKNYWTNVLRFSKSLYFRPGYKICLEQILKPTEFYPKTSNKLCCLILLCRWTPSKGINYNSGFTVPTTTLKRTF